MLLSIYSLSFLALTLILVGIQAYCWHTHYLLKRRAPWPFRGVPTLAATLLWALLAVGVFTAHGVTIWQDYRARAGVERAFQAQ